MRIIPSDGAAAGSADGGVHRQIINYRPMASIAAALIIGVYLGDIMLGAQAAWPAYLFLLLTFAALILKRPRAALFFIAIAVGMLRVTLFFSLPQIEYTGSLTGRVADQPYLERGRLMVTLEGAALEGAPVRGRILLELSGRAPPPRYGDAVSVEAEVATPEYEWGSAYSQRRFLLSKGIAYTARGQPGFTAEPGPNDWYGLCVLIRQSISEKIDEIFPKNSGFINGILLGDKTGMEADTLEAFQATGVYHVLALSGLHAGILGGALLFLLRRAKPVISLAFIALFFMVYSAVAAFPASLIRAGLMMCVMAGAKALGRRYDMFSALSLAAVLILLWSPYQLFSAGFILSFSAVAGLAFLYRPLADKLNRLPRPLSSGVSVSLAATLGSFPFVCRYFGRASVWSLPLNLIIVPLAPVIMIASAIALILSLTWPAAGSALAWCVDYLVSIAQYPVTAFASLPGALTIPSPSLPVCLVYLLGLFFLSPYFLRAPRLKARMSGLCALLCAVLYTVGLLV